MSPCRGFDFCTLSAVANVTGGVYFVAIDNNFKMAVVSVSIAGLPDRGDLLALADSLSRRDIDCAVMGIQCLHTVAMVNYHIVAVAVVPAIGRSGYNRSGI